MSDHSNSPSKARFYDSSERRIRSFVTRTGRLSPAQERAILELGPQFCIPFQKNIIDPNTLFPTPAPLIVEIGFGMGETTAKIAHTLSNKNFIGIEVHTPGVGSLLKQIHTQELSNVRIIQHDAVEVLTHMLAPDSLHGVHIFFPDPWHKARHHKRRLIQSPLVKLLASRLQAGGYLHCATDWQDYADQILSVLKAEPTLQNQSTGFSARPDYRPITKFETRGLRLGHSICDIIFNKKA
jgi:tRNA (guanine-N7-)-methyltransferase